MKTVKLAKGTAYAMTRWHVQRRGIQNAIRMFIERRGGWKEDSES